MAKMFYSLDEACQKLGKSEAEVKSMVSSGQLQEYRDGERLMFKVDQIDLLTHDDGDDDSPFRLEDSAAGGSGLGLSGSGISLEESRAGDSGASGSRLGMEPGDDTRLGQTFEEDLSLDAVGSGSGLLDLTRESDDTSLGAELLEEVYSGEEHIDIPANASGLFPAQPTEPVADESMAVSGVAAMPMIIESYDGSSSGLGVGLMIGALAAMVVLSIVTIALVLGATPQLAMTMTSSSGSMMIWSGGLLGLTILLGIIGLVIGKASE